MAHRLKEVEYIFELRKFDTDHYFTEMKSELNDLVVDWFNKRLKNDK